MRNPPTPPSAGPVFRTKRPSRVRPRSLLRHVALLLVISFILVIAVGALLWLGLGRPNLSLPSPASTPTTRPSGASPQSGLTVADRLNSLKVVLAVVGGIGAIVALTVAYRKQRDGEIAEYREDTKAFADRLTKLVDQIGSPEYQVRSGGIHGLAELADEWEDGRQMCIDILCDYLRFPYEPDPTSSDYSAANREVRRIVIREIRNHLRKGWSSVSWSKYRFSFEGAIFDCGDLSEAIFESGNVTFHNAEFVSGHFEFDKIDFGGTPVYFTRVKFSGAHVTFHEARFTGSKIRFRNAQFTGGRVEFDGAEFANGEVSFDGAAHTGGNVTFDGAVVKTECNVEWGPFTPPTQIP
jgi:hypothetical protein